MMKEFNTFDDRMIWWKNWIHLMVEWFDDRMI